MMKLRIRSLETRETLKIEVPLQCSIQQLRQMLSGALSSSSNSSPPPPDSIRLSLNKADEIQSSSPDEDTLQSLGITSGDLIFYTVKINPNPSAVPSETPIPDSQLRIPVPALSSGFMLGYEDPRPFSTPDQNSEIDQKPLRDHTLMESLNRKVAEPNLPCHQDHQSEGKKRDADREEGSPENMEVDDGSETEDAGKSFSVPGFLRKVFTEELGGDNFGSGNHKLLVIAIHAVLLESGFAGFDMDSKTVVKGFQFRNGWPINAFRLSLFYTLPEIIMDASSSSDYRNCAFVLKFQSVGKFMNVYGSLCSDSVTHSVRLNEDELVSFFNVIWANCSVRDDIVTSEGGILGTSPEKEVFRFWRTVKDNLALPLLIDLCEKVGFELPPCFMRLPTDLKLKILELLPAVDVAKISCVSSELQYLASSDDLWMQKFEEEFGDASKLYEGGPWKKKFGRVFERRKKSKVAKIVRSFPRSRKLFHHPPRRHPHGGPPIIWLSGNHPAPGFPLHPYPSSERQGIRFQSSSQFPSFGNI